jgi:hypothetical protein
MLEFNKGNPTQKGAETSFKFHNSLAAGSEAIFMLSG